MPREETGEAQPSESGMPDVAEPEPDMNGAEADADRDAPAPVEPEEPVVVSEPLSELPAQEGSPVAGETAETPVDEASVQPAVAADDASDNIADLTPRLEMSFQGDCWVQVSDGEGRRLVAALPTSGGSPGGIRSRAAACGDWCGGCGEHHPIPGRSGGSGSVPGDQQPRRIHPQPLKARVTFPNLVCLS